MVYSPTGSGNIHYDQILTQISLAYPQPGSFVGEKLAPVVQVKKQSDKYYVFGREAWIPESSDYRAPGSIANEVPGMQVSLDTYYCQEHALQSPVFDEERENADNAFNPDRDATELVTAKILLGRELAIYNFVTDTARFASGLSASLTSTTKWDVYATSDPITDIAAAKAAIHAKVFFEPNIAVIPYQVMQALKNHPKIIDRIKYTDRAILTEELIAAVLGLSNVIVPGIPYGTASNTSNNFNMSVSYLWGDNVLLAYVPERPGIKVPAFMYEFAWAYPGQGVMATDRWREAIRKADIVRVGRRYDLKMVGIEINPASADAGKSITGYLLKDVLA